VGPQTADVPPSLRSFLLRREATEDMTAGQGKSTLHVAAKRVDPDIEWQSSLAFVASLGRRRPALP